LAEQISYKVPVGALGAKDQENKDTNKTVDGVDDDNLRMGPIFFEFPANKE
jgi:hypothetical protein